MPHRGNGNTTTQQEPGNAQQASSGGHMESIEHRRYGPTSLATAFGIGVGVGVAVGMVLSHQPQVTSLGNQISSFGHQLSAEKLGRAILDSLHKMTPESLAR